MKSLSRVRLLATPWTAAYQAPPSTGFSRQEYWSGVPLPSPKMNPRYILKQRSSLEITRTLIPEKAMAPHSSTLAWRIPRMEKPVGCSPWGRYESDTTEQLHFHFSLSCIGEGNGNPLQGSCLENPRDGGAWWAAVYGVAQSQT